MCWLRKSGNGGLQLENVLGVVAETPGVEMNCIREQLCALVDHLDDVPVDVPPSALPWIHVQCEDVHVCYLQLSNVFLAAPGESNFANVTGSSKFDPA
jgi:hypothetical protein